MYIRVLPNQTKAKRFNRNFTFTFKNVPASAKESSIKAVCPQHIDTGWGNDYDIEKFIIKKRI